MIIKIVATRPRISKSSNFCLRQGLAATKNQDHLVADNLNGGDFATNHRRWSHVLRIQYEIIVIDSQPARFSGFDYIVQLYSEQVHESFDRQAGRLDRRRMNSNLAIGRST